MPAEGEYRLSFSGFLSRVFDGMRRTAHKFSPASVGARASAGSALIEGGLPLVACAECLLQHRAHLDCLF